MQQQPPVGGHAVSQTASAAGHRGPTLAQSTTPSVNGSPRVLLTSDQAAREVFGVSPRTFHGLRAQPWMPQPVVLGPRVVRWVRSELEQAAANMPRATARPEPAQLLRGKVERLKRGVGSQPVAA